MLPEAVTHPASTLLQSYVGEGIPATKGPPCLRTSLVSFIQGELRRQVQDVFIVLLYSKNAVRLFEEKLKLSRIVAVPQYQRRPRLILKFLAPPDKETPSVNNTTVCESITSHSSGGLGGGSGGRPVPSVKSSCDRRVPLRHPKSVPGGVFVYVVPSVPDDDFILICINLLLPMG